MSRLVKGLYTNAGRTESLFGLHDDQERHYPVMIGSTWYNISGEVLGYGDLAEFDFVQIASEIQDDEIFVILPPIPGPLSDGVDHVVSNAWYVIMMGAIFLVRYRTPRKTGDIVDHHQLGELTVITREHLLDLLTAPAPTS